MEAQGAVFGTQPMLLPALLAALGLVDDISSACTCAVVKAATAAVAIMSFFMV